MRTPGDARPETWVRFFGPSANDPAWTLAEAPVAELDRDALLNAAHAAAWHWQHAGDEIHRMRRRRCASTGRDHAR